jgi:thiol-disulfide isomerase/thioredoxin
MVAPKLASRRAAAAAVTGLAAAATLAGCSSGAGGSSSQGYVNVSAGIAQIGTTHRTTAPQLSGTTVAGKTYTTSYTGHVTVINVWGSWCTACREEAASFAETSKKYAADGVQFIGIDTLDNDAGALSYESQFGITYPSLADPDQTLVLSLKSIIPSEGVPSTIIIDKTGKVAVRAIGGITEPELDQELTYALSGS